MIEKKKIFTIITIFLVLFFVPLLKAEATWTYVGIKIDGTMRFLDGSSFCLKANTKLSVTSSDGATTYDTVATTGTVGPSGITPACTTDKIWSNLINLTNGTAYKMKLEVPLCFGYWHRDTGINIPYKCWYRGTQNDGYGRGETCPQVCTDNSTTVAGSCGNFNVLCSPSSGTYCHDWDENCGAAKALLPQYSGATCSVGGYCWTGYQNTDITYVSNNYPADCGYCPFSDINITRVCVCNYNTGVYNFPFTFTTL